MKDLIFEEILRVARGEITPIAAADTIKDWCEEEINTEGESCTEMIEEEEIRLADLEHASFATGVPDMFSDEMRWFWNT